MVTVFRLPEGAMSRAADGAVIATSVTTGGISDKVPIAVVLPAPNPPPTTIFTGTGGGRSAVSGGRANICVEDGEAPSVIAV